MKNLIILIILFTISISVNSQTKIIEIGNEEERIKLPENLSEDVEIIEPLSEIIKLKKGQIFKIVIKSKLEKIPILLLGLPIETYATKNNLELPNYTNEEYLNLSNDEKNKYTLMIPSIEIQQRMDLKSRIILDVKVTSENIETIEIIIGESVLKTFKVEIE